MLGALREHGTLVHAYTLGLRVPSWSPCEASPSSPVTWDNVGDVCCPPHKMTIRTESGDVCVHTWASSLSIRIVLLLLSSSNIYHCTSRSPQNKECSFKQALCPMWLLICWLSQQDSLPGHGLPARQTFSPAPLSTWGLRMKVQAPSEGIWASRCSLRKQAVDACKNHKRKFPVLDPVCPWGTSDAGMCSHSPGMALLLSRNHVHTRALGMEQTSGWDAETRLMFPTRSLMCWDRRSKSPRCTHRSFLLPSPHHLESSF